MSNGDCPEEDERRELATKSLDELSALRTEYGDAVERFYQLAREAIDQGHTAEALLPIKAQAFDIQRLGRIVEAIVDRFMDEELKR